MAWQNGHSRASTAEHKAWSRAVMHRNRVEHGGRCEIAGPRCTGRAEQADHILSVGEGGDEHDVDNGRGACAVCHREKTQQEAARGRAASRARARRPALQHPLQALLDDDS